MKKVLPETVLKNYSTSDRKVMEEFPSISHFDNKNVRVSFNNNKYKLNNVQRKQYKEFSGVYSRTIENRNK